MKPHPLSLFLLVLILVIFGVNSVADYWHLYHYIWWLDIPMHIAGGLWVALAALVLYYRSSLVAVRDSGAHFVFAFAVASALSVGLVWELYEFSVAHAVSLADDGTLDTLKDLGDDLLGALIAAFIFLRKRYNALI